MAHRLASQSITSFVSGAHEIPNTTAQAVIRALFAFYTPTGTQCHSLPANRRLLTLEGLAVVKYFVLVV